MPEPSSEGAAPEMPSLTWRRPQGARESGAVIVVCPGGGYVMHAAHEAEPVADWLNGLGIAAVILRYRLSPNRHPAMLDDALWGMRTVREECEGRGLDPDRVGILGFSAGGHLAATVATEPEHGEGTRRNRPDLAVLIYPVISMQDPHGHTGSRTSLLGDPPDPALCAALSADCRVTAETPPTFLVHSVDDGAVPVENTLLMASALRRAGVPFAAQIYETGGHGYGLSTPDREYGAWPAACAAWLRVRGFALS